jgi:hypothetical protein
MKFAGHACRDVTRTQIITEAYVGIVYNQLLYLLAPKFLFPLLMCENV